MSEINMKKSIKKYFNNKKIEKKFRGKWKVPLSVPPYNWQEVNEVLDSLLKINLTMGKKVLKFEEKFAKYIGTKYAIMVNSGSSANLIALEILKEKSKEKNDKRNEIITPAVTWPTSVYPIVNVGFIPKMIDVELNNFNMKIDELEQNITDKTLAIMVVHLLGNPMNMVKIKKIAKKNDLMIIEDCCEAHGAEYNKIKVGKHGDVGTFSFYASHHITTGEGGMITTDNHKFAELAKSLRAFGWIRNNSQKEKISKKFPEIDKRFLFINLGYNFKPTELAAAFGIHQIKKLDSFITHRQKIANYWNMRLERYSDRIIVQHEDQNTRHVWFGYSITLRENSNGLRKKFMNYLEKNGIETRPIAAGNMFKQPSIHEYKHKKTKTKNADKIMSDSFFIGVHNLIRNDEMKYVADKISEFLEHN